MTVSVTLTGTNQNITAINGSVNITTASTSGWVVGATVQGTGWPAGTKVVSFVANASAVLSKAFTGTTGASAVVVSSVYGSTIAVQLSATGDTATPQAIVNSGFGALTGARTIAFAGAESIEIRLAAGAVFDDTRWTWELGVGGRLRFDEGYGTGEWRSGWWQSATGVFTATTGHTVKYRSWNNQTLGGSSIFFGSAPAGYPGAKPLMRWNDCRWINADGFNMGATVLSTWSTWLAGTLYFDYADNANSAANANFGFSFGSIDKLVIVNANSGIVAANGNNFASIKSLSYAGNFNQGGIDAKFFIPNGYVLEGYAPQIDTSVTMPRPIAGSSSGTTETYANMVLPVSGYDLQGKYQRFGGPNTVKFPRLVSLTFKDIAGAALPNCTLYIRSSNNTVVNAVQSGDYAQNTDALTLVWTGTGNYRTADSWTDYRNQVARVRKYGYVEQETPGYSLFSQAYAQTFFFLADASLSAITEASAAAITGAGINWSTKTITPTANLTLDQLNARMAWELAQTTNSAQANPRTVSGTTLTLTTGWSLVVGAGVTISKGTLLDTLACATVSNAGSIGSNLLVGTLTNTGAVSGVASVSTRLTGAASGMTGTVALLAGALWEISAPATLPTGSAAAGARVRVVAGTGSAGSVVNGRAFTWSSTSTLENSSSQGIVFKRKVAQGSPLLVATAGAIASDTTESVTLNGLDPASLGGTWVLGYIKDADWQARTSGSAPSAWAGWVQTSGTGNSTTVQLQGATVYQVFLRSPGYDAPATPLASIDTATQSVVTLTPAALTNSLGQYLLNLAKADSSTVAMAAKFSYASATQMLEFDNQTGAQANITFLAAFLAFESLFKTPATAFQNLQPVYPNAARTGYVVVDSNPLQVRMTAASNAGAVLYADVSDIYGDPVYARFVANPPNMYVMHPRATAAVSLTPKSTSDLAAATGAVVSAQIAANGVSLTTASQTAVVNATASAVGNLLTNPGVALTTASTSNVATAVAAAVNAQSAMQVVVVSGTSQLAVNNTQYVLTNPAATTVTLPANPATGALVWVSVTNGLATNVIARNGQTIMGLAEDMTIDNTWATVELRFVNNSWRIV